MDAAVGPATPRRAIASRPAGIAALAVAAIVGGGLTRAVAGADAAARVWLLALAVLGAPIVWEMLVAARRGRFATDLVAAAAIIMAIALQQPLAGLVIVVMQSGGEALEGYAEGRASAAVRALEAAAPRHTHRVRGETVEDVDADAAAVNDILLIRPGELVPCDGVVVGGGRDLVCRWPAHDPDRRADRASHELIGNRATQGGAARLLRFRGLEARDAESSVNCWERLHHTQHAQRRTELPRQRVGHADGAVGRSATMRREQNSTHPYLRRVPTRR